MRKTVNAFIFPGEIHYVAECVNINVVTQGKTLDETVANLQEAVELYFEEENMEELGFQPNPAIVITFELEPLAHVQ